MDSLVINERTIGPGHPCFVIAEAGVNHNGNIKLARELIDAAVDAAADAVKFQTFVAELLVTADAKKAAYQERNSVAGETQLEMLKRLQLSFESFRELHDYCQERGIIFLSTPFDNCSADFLDQLGVPAFKVASGELTNLGLLTHIARKGRPMIVSTGMATLGEIEMAVLTINSVGNLPLALLHCVSNYPAEPRDCNLMAMETLSASFGLPIGFSDHTQGIEVSLAAVALGAVIIEKHFTLSRSLPGPDHGASLEPDELKQLVRGIRKVEVAKGHGRKVPVAAELAIAGVARRSVVVTRDISAGEVLTEKEITTRRPGTGLAPSVAPYLIGRTARVRIPSGTILSLEMLE